MEKTEALEKLNELLLLFDEYENAARSFQEAKNALSATKHNYPSKLGKFDAEHKDTFIIGKIGEKPIKPTGAIKLAVPVYLLKKSKYETAIANYERVYPLAEAAYKEQYADERTQLADEDKIEQQEAIRDKKTIVESSKEKYETAKAAFEANTLLSDRLKSKDIVLQLIDFFKDHRADTLKEAINLWYDEKRKDEEEAKAEAHRQELLELEEERVRAAQSAEEYARMQYEEARDAAEYARQAANDAHEAADAAQRMEWDNYYNNSSDSDN